MTRNAISKSKADRDLKKNGRKYIDSFVFVYGQLLVLVLLICFFITACGGYKQGSFPVPIFFIM